MLKYYLKITLTNKTQVKMTFHGLSHVCVISEFTTVTIS